MYYLFSGSLHLSNTHFCVRRRQRHCNIRDQAILEHFEKYEKKSFLISLIKSFHFLAALSTEWPVVKPTDLKDSSWLFLWDPQMEISRRSIPWLNYSFHHHWISIFSRNNIDFVWLLLSSSQRFSSRDGTGGGHRLLSSWWLLIHTINQNTFEGIFEGYVDHFWLWKIW